MWHKLLQSLPPTLGAILAAQKRLMLHQLGKLANELMLLLQSTCLTGPAEQQKPFQPPPLQQPQHHSQALASAYQQGMCQQPANGSSGSLPNGLQPFHRGQRPLICHAHLYFRVQAKTCNPWC